MKSLTDVVSGAGLAGYAEIALLIFILVFIAIALRLLFARGTSFNEAARLPLDDDVPAEPKSTNPSLTRDARGVVHAER